MREERDNAITKGLSEYQLFSTYTKFNSVYVRTAQQTINDPSQAYSEEGGGDIHQRRIQRGF